MNQFKRCSKKSYDIEFEIVEPGIVVYNFLEKADYVTDEEHNVILTGTVGEQWVVTIDKLDSAYLRDKNCDKGVATAIAGGESLWVRFATETEVVETAWGTALEAKIGDAVVYNDKNGEPDKNDRWVVDREVFNNTYEVF